MDTEQNSPHQVIGKTSLTPKFRLSRNKVIGILLLIAIVGVTLLIRSFAAESVQIISSIEGEQLSISPSTATAKVTPISDASGGAAMTLYSQATATWSVTPPSNANRIIVRAEGSNCNGAPTMVISVNGVPALSTSVSSGWADYTASASLPAGKAVQIQIAFTNDYWNPPTCDRNLLIDKASIGYASQLDNVGTVEAEQMNVQSGTYVKAINYSGASAGKAMQFLSSGTIGSTVTPTADVSQLQITAYGTSCQGAPTMIVSLNGKTILTASVSATSWQTYSVDASLPKGVAATLTISFTNDYYVPPSCDRNLYVDKVDMYGKILTSPVPVPQPVPTPTPVPIPAPTPTPTPTPTTGNGSMIVGLNSGNFGASGVTDAKAAVDYVRLDRAISPSISSWKNGGVKVDVDFSGNYNNSGVSGLGDPVAWAASALSWYKSNCDTTECPIVEVLNEPGGTWFWGSGALSQTNANNYATLVKDTYSAFHTAYGTASPKILATYDGASGSSGLTTFGDEWWPAADHSSVDGIIVHPYGLTSDRTASALGNTGLVSTAHTRTGKPIYVTEVGWPTATGQPNTGDSFQWSEADQANNLYNFVNWARGTGYVNAVMYFNYRDYGTNNYYGVTRPDGSHKPSFNALKCAAQNKPQSC